jgi:hypothetical protein
MPDWPRKDLVGIKVSKSCPREGCALNSPCERCVEDIVSAEVDAALGGTHLEWLLTYRDDAGKLRIQERIQDASKAQLALDYWRQARFTPGRHDYSIYRVILHRTAEEMDW